MAQVSEEITSAEREGGEQKSCKILVVDDEKQVRKFLRIGLEGEGYEIIEAPGIEEAMSATVRQRPNLILLDLNLSDGHGLDFLRRLRDFSLTPVIILTVRDTEAEKIELLEAGADDYLTKPFGMGELIARIRVVLRRSSAAATVDEPRFCSGNLEIDYATRTVWVRRQKIHLTPTEYNLLCLLAKNAGKVVTTNQIMREIWGPGLANETGYLRVYMAALRKKIEQTPDRPQLLVNEPAIGYRLIMLPAAG